LTVNHSRTTWFNYLTGNPANNITSGTVYEIRTERTMRGFYDLTNINVLFLIETALNVL